MLTITSIYAALLGLLLLVLSWNVIGFRRSHRVSVGDGGHEDGVRRIRVQGNFVEYTPMVLILLGLLEMQGGAAWGLHALGAAFFLGRVAHAIGLGKRIIPLRMGGMIVTLICLLLAPLWLLGLVLF